MHRLLLAFAALFAPVMGGCDCEDAPDTYRGAPMVGSYSGYSYSCATYANRSCEYTLCQEDCRGWELDSWYCY